MTSIDEAFDDAREAAADLLNVQDRSTSHVVLGVALTVGFALAATLVARTTIRPRPADLANARDGDAPITERPRGAFSLVLPAMFSATTLSAIRVWNAPAGAERTSAMGLWGAAQALNAIWIALRPASRGLQIAAAMTTAGMAAAFAHEARKLDSGTGKLAAPTGMGIRLGNRLDRKVSSQPTVH